MRGINTTKLLGELSGLTVPPVKMNVERLAIWISDYDIAQISHLIGVLDTLFIVHLLQVGASHDLLSFAIQVLLRLALVFVRHQTHLRLLVCPRRVDDDLVDDSRNASFSHLINSEISEKDETGMLHDEHPAQAFRQLH